MSCLFLLSLARLEIACSPYTFYARNHFLLSVLCCLITFGMPILMDVISTVLYGNSCGFQSQLVMKALYGVDMGCQSDYKLKCWDALFLQPQKKCRCSHEECRGKQDVQQKWIKK